jgi:hypothetical protein
LGHELTSRMHECHGRCTPDSCRLPAPRAADRDRRLRRQHRPELLLLTYDFPSKPTTFLRQAQDGNVLSRADANTKPPTSSANHSGKALGSPAHVCARTPLDPAVLFGDMTAEMLVERRRPVNQLDDLLPWNWKPPEAARAEGSCNLSTLTCRHETERNASIGRKIPMKSMLYSAGVNFAQGALFPKIPQNQRLKCHHVLLRTSRPRSVLQCLRA